MIDRDTGRSRGFGFVTFESEDTVERIFSDGKTHELGGKQVSQRTEKSIIRIKIGCVCVLFFFLVSFEENENGLSHFYLEIFRWK